MFDPSEILKILQYQWETCGDLVLVDAPFREPVVFIFNPDYAEQIYRASGSQPLRPGFDALKYTRNQDEMTQKAKGFSFLKIIFFLNREKQFFAMSPGQDLNNHAYQIY